FRFPAPVKYRRGLGRRPVAQKPTWHMAQVQFMQERPDLLPRALDAAFFLLGLSGLSALFFPFGSGPWGVIGSSPWGVTGYQIFRSGYVYGPEWGWKLFLLGAPFLLAVRSEERRVG